MRRFMFVTAFLFIFMTGQVLAADNLTNAASKIESGILSTLNGIGSTIFRAAKETGKTGLQRETEIRKLLQKNWLAGRPYAINSTFIDSKGIMKFIEPEQYRIYEGSDISEQEAIIKMLKTKKPRMGKVFVSVEGVKCIDIAYPVFSKKKQFLGSVSMIVKHSEMIRAVVEPIEKDLGVKIWVMQKDGLILYDTNPADTGLNLFTDPRYKDFPEVFALAKRMSKEKSGTGLYSFPTPETKNIVKKQAVWKTVHFLNNDWIIVTYNEVK